MKRISKFFTLAVALFVLTAVSVTALAEYGSGAVREGQTYTTEQMLTYAIQDEYMALAEYQAIMEKFDVSRPFSNIASAEQVHISLLTPLLATYGVEVPANDAASRVTLPETLEQTYEAGVAAEKNNIAMYEAFLSQNLPDDVKAVFTQLKSASENHLRAFERNEGRTGGARMGIQVRGNGRNRMGVGGGMNRANCAGGNGGTNCGNCASRNGGASRGNCGQGCGGANSVGCANCPVAPAA